MANVKYVTIYTLSDPETDQVRYVGKTIQPLLKRYSKHLSDPRINHRTCWIKSIINKGLLPKIEIIDIVDAAGWEIMEIYWISQLKCWGFDLVNYTVGGDSLNGYVHSEETKLKLSIKQTGKKYSLQSRKKMSDSRRKYELENKVEFNARYEKAKLTNSQIPEDIKRNKYINAGREIKKAYSKMPEEQRIARGLAISRSKGSGCSLIDITGIILKTYPSFNAASKDNNISHESVSRSCLENRVINGLKFELYGQHR